MQVSQIADCENEFPPANPGETGLLSHLLQHLLGWTVHTESPQHGCERDWPPALGSAWQGAAEDRKELRDKGLGIDRCKETRQAHVK